MTEKFDPEEAKKFLSQRQDEEKEKLELERQHIFKQAVSFLTAEFKGSDVEVYLIGSVIQPYRFTTSSDVDIVLKNFTGDRFDIWPRCEEMIGREVEVIQFEKCTFQDFVINHGYKVI